MKEHDEIVHYDGREIARISAQIANLIEQTQVISSFSDELRKQLETVLRNLEDIYVNS